MSFGNFKFVEIPLEQEAVVSRTSQGEYKEISFQFLTEKTKLQLYSNRRGWYAVAENNPDFIIWTRIVAPPAGIKFFYNRHTKVLRLVLGQKLLMSKRVNMENETY